MTGGVTPAVLARGNDWSVADVVCTSGPDDRRFEEAHTRATIAIVVAGTFQYQTRAGCELMTPGSLMLGNAGQCYECGHEHGAGDRCVSFWYAPDFFEELLADAGLSGRDATLPVARIPPLRTLAPLVARASAGLLRADSSPWEELSLVIPGRVAELSAARLRPPHTPLNAESRVIHATRTIDRAIEDHPDAPLTLTDLARGVRLSPYHFLRMFQQVAGITPHQYILRARLRHAAVRLVSDSAHVLDVALDAGFGDLSNFNRAFRAEFGVSPRVYRHSKGRLVRRK